MKRYDISDIVSSKQVEIDSENAILIICNDHPRYRDWLYNCLKNIIHLHDVRIIFVSDSPPPMEAITRSLAGKKHNIEYISTQTIYDLYKNANSYIKDKSKVQPLPGPFCYLKPCVYKYIMNNNDKFKVKKLLYMDVDLIVLRRLDVLFDFVDKQPMLAEELGFPLKNYPWESFMHKDPIVYDQYFPGIPVENRAVYPQMFANNGVLCFDLTRKLDQEILNLWHEYTKVVVQNNLDFDVVKWHDQGVMQLALEKLGLVKLITKERQFNHTVYVKNERNFDLTTSTDKIVHFVGDTKPDLKQLLMNSNLKYIDNIRIVACGHKDEQEKLFHPRSYLKFYNLNKLEYSDPRFASNSLGEARLFLADNIYENIDSDILGCVTASWDTKYKPLKIDSMMNWPMINKIMNADDSTVFCASLCYGKRARAHAPSWETNFQKHFRLDYPGTEFIEEKIFKITGLKYDMQNLCPYANQIICRRELFLHFKGYMKNIAPTIIDEFGLDFQFPKESVAGSCCYDKRRSLAYVLEEVSMLWWANQQNLKYFPVCQIADNWYSDRNYLR